MKPMSSTPKRPKISRTEQNAPAWCLCGQCAACPAAADAPTFTETLLSEAPDWCHCGRCVSTNLSRIERRCCRQTSGDCCLLDQDLQHAVLQEAVVRTAINSERLILAQVYGDGYSNRRMRHKAYGQFVALTVGATGFGTRVVVPACVVAAIRSKWPSADGVYTGFKKAISGKAMTVTQEGGRAELDENFSYDDEL